MMCLHSIKWLHINETITATTTPGQGRPGSSGNERVLHILQNSRMAASQSEFDNNIIIIIYGHLPPITKTIQVRRTRHAGHCWRSRDELIRDVLLWTPKHGRAKAGRLARTYIQQLCEDTGCCPEDLPRAMNDREEWWERVRDIRATSAIWWWWLLVTWNYIIAGKLFVLNRNSLYYNCLQTNYFRQKEHF